MAAPQVAQGTPRPSSPRPTRTRTPRSPVSRQTTRRQVRPRPRVTAKAAATQPATPRPPWPIWKRGGEERTWQIRAETARDIRATRSEDVCSAYLGHLWAPGPAEREPSDVGNRHTNYAPWVRRRERPSVTAVGDIAACIETRVRTVRTRTDPRRSSGGTSAVELSGRGRKPPRLPAGPPAAAAARHGGRAIYAAHGSARRRRSADGGPRSKPRERCRGSSRGGAMGPGTRRRRRQKRREPQGHRPSEVSPHNTVPAAVSAVRLTSGRKQRHARETIGAAATRIVPP